MIVLLRRYFGHTSLVHRKLLPNCVKCVRDVLLLIPTGILAITSLVHWKLLPNCVKFISGYFAADTYRYFGYNQHGTQEASTKLCKVYQWMF